MADLRTRFFRSWLVVVVCGAAGCGQGAFDYGAQSEGPGGRHQNVALSAQQEVKLGDEAFQEVLAKEHPVGGPEAERVRTIAEKIFRQALENEPLRHEIGLRDHDPYGTPYNFNDRKYAVLKNDAVNAFCLPGGKVAVFTGLIDLTKDKDAWLAAVLGHEIGHAVAHHASERIAREQMYGHASDATAGLTVLDQSDRTKLLDLLGVGQHALQYAGDGPQAAESGSVFSQFRDLAFDRQQESEADHIGVFLMVFADDSYDPEEAVSFWQAMEERSGDKGVPEILSDHPSDKHRVDQMKQWAVRAKAARDAWHAGNIARTTAP